MDLGALIERVGETQAKTVGRIILSSEVQTTEYPEYTEIEKVGVIAGN